MTPLIVNGFEIYPEALSPGEQRVMAADLRDVAAKAPFFRPAMPGTGKPFSVEMTNCGPLGWVSDKIGGYRYEARHPETIQLWPPIPASVLAVWERFAGYPHPPEAALINFYCEGAKMGLHTDNDEDARDAPVVSISLGDTCLFRMGGPKRADPTKSLKLGSGAVVVIGGPARHFHHGVHRIYPGTSTLLTGGGRLNVTLRRVTKP